MALVTASTTPKTLREGDAPALAGPAGEPDLAAGAEAAAAAGAAPHTGSLSQRMMLIAAGWITILLVVGGVALDRTMASLITNQFDDQLEYILTAMIGSAEIGPEGEVYFNRPLGDQQFLEPNSGLYWQISGVGHDDWPSRSLWDRTLSISGEQASEAYFYDSAQFEDEKLRVVERSIRLPGSEVSWQFVVAGAREELDGQLADIRAILIWSFAILGIGLFILAMLQTWYGLGPLRRIRNAIARIRTTGMNRVTDPLPLEVQPMVEELNALLAHSVLQAEEARTHAGNLAHALKTPLTVLTNAASAHSDDLDETVLREAAVMRRQVDHHLARARAVGRRASGHSRAKVLEAAKAVQRAVSRLHQDIRFDVIGSADALVAIERQDLEEILGNLIDNAAKYGGGSVFVTVDPDPEAPECTIWVEDDGIGIPEAEWPGIFARGARLDTEQPGTGLGLAIVRDVVEIYGGSIGLDESEELGGLLVKVTLPRAG